MRRTWWIAVLRLTALLGGTSLALGRMGLLAHELVGHGGTAIAVGGTVTDVHLFWFAGGWIRYRVPQITRAQDLAIMLGGVAIETVLGIALWVGLRARTGLGARLLRAAGQALLVHAMFYLATGTWHGYGDGRLIHELAGGARTPIAIAAGLVAIAAGWSGARHLFGALVAAAPPPRLAGALVAIAVAAAVNIALDVGELQLRRDATYAVTMQPERERIMARELAAWQRAQKDPVSDAERAAHERELAKAHRELPFRWVLGAGVVLAIVAGAARSARSARSLHPTEHAALPRLLAIACSAAVISTAAVIAIGAAFHYW